MRGALCKEMGFRTLFCFILVTGLAFCTKQTTVAKFQLPNRSKQGVELEKRGSRHFLRE